MRPDVLTEALWMLRQIVQYADGPPYISDPTEIRLEFGRIEGTARAVIENLETNSTVRDRLTPSVARRPLRHSAPDGLDGDVRNGRCMACEDD
jgi:hypothetical protein